MGDWDLQELRELCLKHRLADPQVYIDSFQWHFLRAPFHAERAESAWKELWQLQSFTWGGDKWNIAEFSYEAEAEACVYALHTTADILAQIINVAVLNSELNEHDVSMRTVKKAVEKGPVAPGVLTKLQNLLDSYAFQYVSAFSNTSKHRKL